MVDGFSDGSMGGVWGEAVIYRGGIEEREAGEEVCENCVALGFNLSGVAPGATVDEDCPEGFVGGVGVPNVKSVEGMGGGGFVGDNLYLVFVRHR